MSGLYETDLVLWSQEQARALRDAARTGANFPIDWEHVAEEIESLGAADRRALASHIRTVIEHLLKLEVSPATRPVRGWRESVLRARQDIRQLLKDSPSLKRELPEMIAEGTKAARALVRISLAEWEEQLRIDLDTISYTEAQVLGDLLPD